jgi:hypothetical protein
VLPVAGSDKVWYLNAARAGLCYGVWRPPRSISASTRSWPRMRHAGPQHHHLQPSWWPRAVRLDCVEFADTPRGTAPNTADGDGRHKVGHDGLLRSDAAMCGRWGAGAAVCVRRPIAVRCALLPHSVAAHYARSTPPYTAYSPAPSSRTGSSDRTPSPSRALPGTPPGRAAAARSA